MIQEIAQIDNISSNHCFVSSLGLQSLKKLVNAGGLDVMDVLGTSCYLRFTEGITLLGGGSNDPNLVRNAIATSTPALTVFSNAT